MSQSLGQLLSSHDLVLLFVVIVLGLILAKIEIKGVKLGLSGVLFAGLLVSAWMSSPSAPLKISTELKEFGLTLFVYCVGLSSAPGFFSAFKEQGLKLNLAVVLALCVGGAMALLGGQFLHFNSALIAGMFCGALTNTPALGAATHALAARDAESAVLAYSICYPFGVLGALFLFRFFAKHNEAVLATEQAHAAKLSHPQIVSSSCVVTQAEVADRCIGELKIFSTHGVVISRLRRGAEVIVPNKYSQLALGDILTLVGESEKIGAALEFLGEPSSVQLNASRDQVDMRRILVSKREFTGKTLAELGIEERFNAQITRLRRADFDLIPTPQLRLEIGDRLRIVAPRERLAEVAAFFGDSQRELAEIDFVSIALGICLGLLLGQVPIPLFGATVSLGSAGGPLVVALLLGRLGRTGPLTWSIPFEANQTLRDLGLLLFLASVGVSAGGQLSQVMNPNGLWIIGLGAVVTIVTTMTALLLLRKWARVGVIESMGVTSGMQTQPATLAAAYELSGKTELTYVAYAVVYPVGMIGKIIIAQLLALMG